MPLRPCLLLFLDRIEPYGIERPLLRWRGIATESGCTALFGEAGLKDIRVDWKNHGYSLESAEKWWDVVWNGVFRGVVDHLSVDAMQTFKAEHLQEMETLRADNGIWLNLEVLFTMGIKI
jgi:hypothetical protein